MGIGPPEPAHYVVGDPDGSYLHPEAASKRFDRRAARYGLPHIGVHGLRRISHPLHCRDLGVGSGARGGT